MNQTKNCPQEAIPSIQGTIYQQSGEFIQARKAFDTALRMAPHMPLVHYPLGNLEQENGNSGSAIRHFEQFLSGWNRDPAMVHQVRQNLEVLRQAS